MTKMDIGIIHMLSQKQISVDKLKIVGLLMAIFIGLFYYPHFPKIQANMMGHCKSFISQDPEIDGEIFKWKPNGCKMYNYTLEELKKCFTMKKDGMVHVAIMGDSRVRNIYEYIENMVTGTVTNWNVKPHHNLNLTHEDLNLKVDFIWGPQTEIGNQTLMIFNLTEQNTPMNKALEAFFNDNDNQDPDVLVMANGPWSLYCKPNLTLSLEEYKIGLKKLRPILENMEKRGKTKIFWLKSPYVDEANILKTFGPFSARISNKGLEMHTQLVLEELADLFKISRGFMFWTTPDFFVRNELNHSPDGLHFHNPQTIKNVNSMMFNFYCNERLGLSDEYCCNKRYNEVTLNEKIFAIAFCVIFCITSVLWLIHYIKRSCSKSDNANSGPNYLKSLTSLTKLCIIIVYIYACDKLFISGTRNLVQMESIIIIVTIFILGIWFQNQTKDSSFMNDNQINELKGLMILLILVLSISGDSIQNIQIFAFVVFVKSAFVFLQGYQVVEAYQNQTRNGKTKIIFKELFGLNMVVLQICLLLKINYFEIELLPFISLWFVLQCLITYLPWPACLTPKVFNTKPMYSVSLRYVIAVITTIILNIEDISDGIFQILIKINVSEIKSIKNWWLNGNVSSLLGMGFAIVVQMSSSSNFKSTTEFCKSTPKKLLIGIGCCLGIISCIFWIFNYSTFEENNSSLTFLSLIPVICYFFLRNLHDSFSKRYFRVLVWFGKISLELYVLQNIIWKTRLETGILTLVPEDVFLNLSIVTSLFILAAHEVNRINKQFAASDDMM